MKRKIRKNIEVENGETFGKKKAERSEKEQRERKKEDEIIEKSEERKKIHSYILYVTERNLGICGFENYAFYS